MLTFSKWIQWIKEGYLIYNGQVPKVSRQTSLQDSLQNCAASPQTSDVEHLS